MHGKKQYIQTLRRDLTSPRAICTVIETLDSFSI